MFIARLIADNLDWETRLEEMIGALAPTSEVSPDLRPIAAEPLRTVPSVLELRFDTKETQLVANILDTHFGRVRPGHCAR